MRNWQARVLGGVFNFAGDITKNSSVGPKDGAGIERSLGFAPGRLAGGWSVLVLKEPIGPDDFRFAGLTLRSGGRLGLPAASAALDRGRPHVTETMQREYTAAEYRQMQVARLRTIQLSGPERIVKVVPWTPHDPAMAPDRQYPMGGGGLQWTLIRPRAFLVAMTVDAFGIARIPGFCTRLHARMAYDDRAKLARHIAAA